MFYVGNYPTEQNRIVALNLGGGPFAFTKLITCGNCSSGITAEEKFKNLKDGGRSRHVYYKCTRSKNQSCLTRINEQDLIIKLKNIIDTIDLNKLALKKKYKKKLIDLKDFKLDYCKMKVKLF